MATRDDGDDDNDSNDDNSDKTPDSANSDLMLALQQNACCHARTLADRCDRAFWTQISRAIGEEALSSRLVLHEMFPIKQSFIQAMKNCISNIKLKDCDNDLWCLLQTCWLD